MRILAVIGSLRARSSNAALMRAAAAVAPPGVEIVIDESIGALPHFNPDLDGEGAPAPPAVAAFRARLTAADAVIVCSPEYAHGVPGVMKNALDWLVSTVELIAKPVAIVTGGPGGGPYAQAQLAETLRTMSWRVSPEGCAALVLGRAQLDARGDVSDAAILECLRACMAALIATVGGQPESTATDGPRG
jgi:NAD(P)H-dependent FMN reductase